MILISGDGASGSSYLVWLLRELGFSNCPKGYELPDLPSGEPVTYELLREKRIQDNMDKIDWSTVGVIKHLGGFSYDLSKWVKKYNWHVDHVFIVTRKLEEGIRRRWLWDPVNHPISHKFLGVTLEEFQKMDKEQIDARARHQVRERIGSAVLECIEMELPFTVMGFPRFAEEPAYLYSCLRPVIGNNYQKFRAAYDKVTDLRKVKTY